MRKVNVRYRCGVCRDGAEVDDGARRGSAAAEIASRDDGGRPDHGVTARFVPGCPQAGDKAADKRQLCHSSHLPGGGCGSAVDSQRRLGHGEQPAEQAHQADHQRDVAVGEDEVAQHDRDGAEDEQGEHQHRHPRRALLGALGHRRRVSHEEAPTAPDEAVRAAFAGVATLSPGLVPAGVVRPPVLRFGGAADASVRSRTVSPDGGSPPAQLTDRRYRPAGDAGARARQLRQLRLQPRPVPRRARGPSPRSSTATTL